MQGELLLIKEGAFCTIAYTLSETTFQGRESTPTKKEMTPQCHLFFTNLNFPVLETGVYDRVYAQVLN